MPSCTGQPDNPCDEFRGKVNQPTLSRSGATAQPALRRIARGRNVGRHLGVDPSSLSLNRTRIASKASPNGAWKVRQARVESESSGLRRSPRRSSKASAGGEPTQIGTLSASRDVIGIGDGGGDCLSIARSIAGALPAWRAARDEFKSTLRSLIDVVTIDPTTGTIGIKRPEVEKYTSLDQAAYNLMVQQTTLNILAIGYTQEGCRSNLWPDATVPSWSGSNVTFECHTESGWEISFDGGDTWEPISVTVCEFVNME